MPPASATVAPGRVREPVDTTEDRDSNDAGETPVGAPATEVFTAVQTPVAAVPAAATPDGATEVRRAQKRSRRRWLWVAAIPVGLILLLVAAWAVDGAVTGDDVARNTELAGTPVGGMDEAELAAAVEELAAELPGTDVVIETGDLTLETTAGSLGLGLDPDATTELVLETGETEPLWKQPFEWAGSFITPRAAEVVLSVDETAMETTIAELEGEDRLAPVEPSLVISDGSASLSPGVDGIELTVGNVTGALPDSLGDVSSAITVTTERTVVPPEAEDSEVQPLVDQANSLRDRTIEVTAGEQSFELEGTSLIDGVSTIDSGDGTRQTVSEEVIGQQIAAQSGVDANPTGVRFTAGGAGLVPTPGRDVAICCGEGATDAIIDALLAGQTEVDVPTRTYSAAEAVEWAATLGVNQPVAEFTTNHPCCQGRVRNIHNIAEQLRGVLIAPGETFSVNETTGPRTTSNGYVAAPAIIDGEYVQDVGGGVSQFATTLFNAAFFAGLPMPEYKMHSEYISRYPYAREATMFYPSVDLKITNDTPHGVVIWPRYTDTSITVQLWSTPFARGEETGKSKQSGCGSVTTTRTITYPDGNQDQDSFRANYRCS
jgi:vancomycin resistance protein YoaR